MTWVMAGPSWVCKTLREGFDSLPRLQIRRRISRAAFKAGERFGKHIAAQWGDCMSRSIWWRPFCSGIHYVAWRDIHRQSDGSDRRVTPLYKLLVDKHMELAETYTKLSALREKHIEMSRELSKLKRGQR